MTALANFDAEKTLAPSAPEKSARRRSADDWFSGTETSAKSRRRETSRSQDKSTRRSESQQSRDHDAASANGDLGSSFREVFHRVVSAMERPANGAAAVNNSANTNSASANSGANVSAEANMGEQTLTDAAAANLIDANVSAEANASEPVLIDGAAENDGGANLAGAAVGAESNSAEESSEAIERLLESGLFTQPLTETQEEILARVAILIADNGLDAPLLSNLNEQEIAELADWLHVDPAGLFATETTSNETAPKNLPAVFGDAAEALLQFARLQERLAAAPVGDTALIGEIVGLRDLSALEVDKLAQALQNVLPADAEKSLRQLLQNADAEKLKSALSDALMETSGAEKISLLDDLPEAVVKSLAIEIINVNNAEIAAAEKNLALLDGLTGNANLRAAMLEQVANSPKLPLAVDAEKIAANTEIAEELLASEETLAESAPKLILGTEVETKKNDADKSKTARQDLPITENETDADTENPEVKNIAELTAEKISGADKKTAPTASEKKSTPNVGAAENPLEIDEIFGAAESSALEITASDASELAPHLTKIETPPPPAPINNSAPTAQVSRQEILQDNINRLAELLDNANTNRSLKSLTLALNPPELGEVTVKLEVSSSGAVSAVLRAENETARTLLMSGLDSLRKTLEDKGISLEQFKVELGGKDASDQNFNQHQNQNTGGDWFAAMSDERDRRARNSANQLRGLRGVESGAEDDGAEKVRIRLGSSFELIA
jgi:flagellar hook-length control protein FliK